MQVMSFGVKEMKQYTPLAHRTRAGWRQRATGEHFAKIHNDCRGWIYVLLGGFHDQAG